VWKGIQKAKMVNPSVELIRQAATVDELSVALQESEEMRQTIGRSAEMFGVAL
jgi:hypothetical protein